MIFIAFEIFPCHFPLVAGGVDVRLGVFFPQLLHVAWTAASSSVTIVVSLCERNCEYAGDGFGHFHLQKRFTSTCGKKHSLKFQPTQTVRCVVEMRIETKRTLTGTRPKNVRSLARS